MEVVIVAALLSGVGVWCALPTATRRFEGGPRARGVGTGHTHVHRTGGDGETARWRRVVRAVVDGRGRWRTPAMPADQHVRALRQLASLLRSGRTPAEAWALLGETWGGLYPDPRPAAEAGPAGDILAACRAARSAHEMGLAPSSGIERHVRAQPGGHSRIWVRLLWCVRLSETTGAALSDLLERLAGQLESSEDRRLALESALAGPRATQRMLAWLPVFGLGLAQLVGAEPLAVLMLHPAGRLCLVAGMALWWANRAWGRRLVAGAAVSGVRR